jgi:hypothetical protein
VHEHVREQCPWFEDEFSKIARQKQPFVDRAFDIAYVQQMKQRQRNINDQKYRYTGDN